MADQGSDTGLAVAGVIPVNAEPRFWAKVDKAGHSPGACWLWTAGCCDGYGRFAAARKNLCAHRVAYELLIGSIPEGLELDHLCRVRHCVNPAHLEPVTHAENVRRGRVGSHNSDKTHCKSGHLLAGADVTRDANGWRVCLACKRERGRRDRKENPERARAAGRAWDQRNREYKRAYNRAYRESKR